MRVCRPLFLLSDGYLAVQDDSARREQDVREAGRCYPLLPRHLHRSGSRRDKEYFGEIVQRGLEPRDDLEDFEL